MPENRDSIGNSIAPLIEIALGRFNVTGTGGGGTTTELIANTSVAVPVPPPLVALKVTVAAPAAVGVPEISPVPVLMLSPAGKPMALKLSGLFVAVI